MIREQDYRVKNHFGVESVTSDQLAKAARQGVTADEFVSMAGNVRETSKRMMCQQVTSDQLVSAAMKWSRAKKSI